MSMPLTSQRLANKNIPLKITQIARATRLFLLACTVSSVAPAWAVDIINDTSIDASDNDATKMYYVTNGATLTGNNVITNDIRLGSELGTGNEIGSLVLNGGNVGGQNGLRVNGLGSLATVSGSILQKLVLNNGGRIEITNSTITDTTGVNTPVGSSFESFLKADNVIFGGSTSISSSSAEISNSRITSTNVFGFGLYNRSYALISNTDITGPLGINLTLQSTEPDNLQTLELSNSRIHGTTGAAIQTGLLNNAGIPVLGANAHVLLSNGSTLSSDTGVLVNVTAASELNLVVDNSHLSGGDINVDDGKANITLQNNASFTGNYNIASTSTGALTLTNGAQMQGDIVVASGGTGDVTLLNNANLTGRLDNVNSLAVGNASRFTMVEDTQLNSLALSNNGAVSFGDASSGFKTLTLDSLTGEGSFYMNTDVSAQLADLLDVTGTANGNHTLHIANSGAEPAEADEQLHLVQTGGGSASFAINGGKVDIGTWEYGLVKNGNNWYLVQDGEAVIPVDPVDPVDPTDPTDPVDPTDPTNPIDPIDPGTPPPAPTTTPSTDALLNIASAPQFMFYGELENLRSRRVALHNATHQDGVWGNFLYNGDNVTGAHASSYKLAQSGMQLGADTRNDTAWGDVITGVFASTSSGKVKNARNGESNIDSWGLGLYATLLTQKGFYLDATLKGNRYSSDLSTSMSDGTAVSGGWHQYGYGADLEGGWMVTLPDNYWTQPYARLSGYQGQSKSVTLSNGMQADLGMDKSLRGELGVSAGKDFTPGKMVVSPYITIGVVQEFVDNNTVNINNAYDFNNDFSGTTGKYGAGINVALTKSADMYAEASYRKGHNVESPVSGNIGIRVNF